jgi:deoxyribonuclease V
MAHPRRGKIDPATLLRWKARQEELADRVRQEPIAGQPRLVAGVDCAFQGDQVVAGAVVWDVAEAKVVEEAVVRVAAEVPYIPGYLSFREGPAAHRVLDRLRTRVDAVIFDGQGIAHPRRCGLATHVGVERTLLAVGCAKSRLIGEYEPVGEAAGDGADLLHNSDVIGRVLRTRTRVKPVFVSVGHRSDLAGAIKLVEACRTRYRLPEPTRLADRLVARAKREGW